MITPKEQDQGDFTQRSIRTFIKLANKNKLYPREKPKDKEVVGRFWKRFAARYKNVILNNGFVDRFICFSFHLIYENDPNLTVNKFFSTKALDLWDERKDQFYEISNKSYSFVSQENLKHTAALNKPYDEKERGRYLNKKNGFIHCIETTTLIDPESENCKFCNSKYDCKKLLKSNYPKLYNQRYED